MELKALLRQVRLCFFSACQARFGQVKTDKRV